MGPCLPEQKKTKSTKEAKEDRDGSRQQKAVFLRAWDCERSAVALKMSSVVVRSESYTLRSSVGGAKEKGEEEGSMLRGVEKGARSCSNTMRPFSACLSGCGQEMATTQISTRWKSGTPPPIPSQAVPPRVSRLAAGGLAAELDPNSFNLIERACTNPGSREAGRRASPSGRQSLWPQAGSCVAIRRERISEKKDFVERRRVNEGRATMRHLKQLLKHLRERSNSIVARTTRCGWGKTPAENPPQNSTRPTWQACQSGESYSERWQ